MSSPHLTEKHKKPPRSYDDSSISATGRKSSSPRVDSVRHRTSSNAASPARSNSGSKISRTTSEAERARKRSSSSIKSGSSSPSPADIRAKVEQRRQESLLGKSSSSTSLVRKKKEKSTRRKQISRSQESPGLQQQEEEEEEHLQYLEKYRTYTPGETKQFLGLIAEDGTDIENDLLWSSDRRRPLLTNKDWESYPTTLDKFSKLIEAPAGYHLELGLDIGEESSPQNELFLEDLPRYAHYYEKYFFGKEHINYIYIEDEKFPICVSVEVPQVKDQTSVKALIHTKDRDEPVLITGASSKERLRALKQLQERLSSVTFLRVFPFFLGKFERVFANQSLFHSISLM
eukprot:TRINITY_DN2051_c0_g2_i1.p1 TRINITY_DN2051_c0_g2~~TRINITY_DN2051_c0_g2_i1.p1  ORF type:complete len:383 (-),score=82.22 TRINITY_DN2051_c0_g2_i1:1700-2734(-)